MFIASMSAMFLYDFEGSVYLNVTNRCPTACRFCVKTDWEWSFRGRDLRLESSEPPVGEILAAMDERLAGPAPREIVFCGFGEPTLRLDAVNAVAAELRRRGGSPPLRLNTVGLGSLVHGRDIVPELAPLLDAVSVSLNTVDPALWEELHRPAPRWRGRGFQAARVFAQGCVAAGLRTRVTAVEGTGADLDAVRAYADSIGAEFLARPALD